MDTCQPGTRAGIGPGVLMASAKAAREPSGKAPCSHQPPCPARACPFFQVGESGRGGFGLSSERREPERKLSRFTGASWRNKPWNRRSG